MNAKLNLAIIGCGALTELVYLPILSNHEFFNLKFIIDLDLERIKHLSAKYSIPHYSSNYEDIFDKVDAALIVLPNFLHASVTVKLLQNNIHALVEKPMAIHSKECKTMIDASSSYNKKLAVGQVRRFYKNVQFLKYIIQEKILGEIINFNFSEGYVLDWPVQSDAIIKKNKSGGGVLIDTGVHLLDLGLYWMGDFDKIEYYDDNMGGTESECFIKMKMKNGVEGKVTLSRIRNLQNSCKFQFEKGDLELGISSNALIKWNINKSYVLQGILNEFEGGQKTLEAFKLQLADFAKAILYNTSPMVDGIEGSKAIALIEKCYAEAKSLDEVYLHY